MRKWAAVLALTAVVACTGDTGPMGPPGPRGPEGPEGPQGPPGPGMVVFSGQLNGAGRATVKLPSTLGTLADPPGLSCLLSKNAEGPYVPSGDIICGLTTQGNHLVVEIIGPPRWYYNIVVIR